MKKPKLKRHSFQPGAMSIIQMGEELIGHPSTAINELVKNGYDADATSCDIYFHYARTAKLSFALIFDNGNGMDDKTLFGDWLKPSVSSKRKPNAKSDLYHRSLLGSKGIGRLAAMALGERVTVISRKSSAKPFNWITINRVAFKEDKLLAEVDFPGDRISDYNQLFLDSDIVEERKGFVNNKLVDVFKYGKLTRFTKGTLIVIECLDDAVLKILNEDFRKKEALDDIIEPYKNTRFYKALATLITPLNLNTGIQQELQKKKIIKSIRSIAKSNSLFNVRYSTNLLPNVSPGKIEWLSVDPISVQTVYDYRVFGKVTEDGTVNGVMSFKRLTNDIHDEEFDIKPSEPEDLDDDDELQQELFDSEEEMTTGEYYFDIRVYDIGEKDNLEKLAKQAKLSSAANFRSTFKEFQGLRISKNGFGVKPYGEEVEDWIELSKARVQNPGQNVNTNQILGYVFFFSPENDNLEEKTNREGFLENKAFIQVRNTLKNIFSVLGKKRYVYRQLHNLGRTPTSKHQRPDIEDFLQNLTANNASTQIVKITEDFMKEVTTSLDNLEESLSFSERLASLGYGLELVYHEMAQPISSLRTTKSSLDIKKSKIAENLLNSFISDITTIHHAADVLAELRQSLQPAIGRTRKKKFVPYNTFLKVCNLYKSDIEENQLKVIADSRLKDYEITDLEYAFWITFLNIINNAIYWLKKAEKGGEIRFRIEKENFVISNSGPFINDEIVEIIFDYGVTTRSEKNATGLGLAFTQSVLSRNGWQIRAENRKDGPAFIIKKNSNG